MKKKFITAYKILRVIDKEFYSMNTVNVDSPISVKYHIDDKWTYPKVDGSKLFVFLEMNDALEAANRYQYAVQIEKTDRWMMIPRFALFQCEVEKAVPIDTSTWVEDEGYLVNWWKMMKKGTPLSDSNMGVPKGSFGAGRVRLTKRLL